MVKDPGNTDNEGKVFLYRYGQKIMEKLDGLQNPEFDDIEPHSPYDMWEGCNFNLRIKKKDGYRNYDDSNFAKPSQLLDSDDDMEAVWEKSNSLAAFIADDQFKSYDELKKKLNRVLGLDSNDETMSKEDKQEEKPKESSKTKKEKVTEKEAPAAEEATDNDLPFEPDPEPEAETDSVNDDDIASLFDDDDD